MLNLRAGARAGSGVPVAMELPDRLESEAQGPGEDNVQALPLLHDLHGRILRHRQVPFRPMAMMLLKASDPDA